MAIYSRGGGKVEIVRPVTCLEDVAALEQRHTDEHDQQRLSYGMYVILRHSNGQELLGDLGLLRADDGILEINRAARLVGCKV